MLEVIYERDMIKTCLTLEVGNKVLGKWDTKYFLTFKWPGSWLRSLTPIFSLTLNKCSATDLNLSRRL